MLRTRGAVLVVCASLGIASAETAQQKADRLFAEGRKALTANDSQRACELFEEAIRIDANATGTLLNLGLCYENLKRYATSLYWFRKAQSAASEGQLTDYEDAAKQHTAQNAPKVSILSLAVSGADDADVQIDGRVVAATDFGRVELDSGEHTIVARSPGKLNIVQKFTIAESEQKAVNLTFEQFVDRGAGRRKTGLILGAVGTATLIGVGIYGLYTRSQYYSLYEDGRGEDAEKKSDNLRIYGTSAFVVGAAALAAGAILYFTAPSSEQPEATAWVPVLSPDELGVAYVGRF